MTAGLSWQIQHFGMGLTGKPPTARHMQSAHKVSDLAPKTAQTPVPRASV
jgi:hypothetical protein